jgi:hypothetical protein
MSDGCPGTSVLTWLEPRMVFRHAAILTFFAWLLSYLLWWVMCRGYATTCSGLWTVADRSGYKALWQASSRPIALYRPMWRWTTFLGNWRPLGRVICFSVDRPDPWWTRSFMENTTLIGVSLSDVRVIMAIMRVLVVKLLCQAVMGQVLVLECLLCHTWF